MRILIENKKHDKISYSIAISILGAYFIFANMSGELGAPYLTLLLIGFFLKLLKGNTKVLRS